MSAQLRSTPASPASASTLIEGVPRLVRGQGQDCTFAGALAAALGVTSHPYDYDDLMGLSGLAFRIRWANEDVGTWWCHSCAAGEAPDQVAALRRATGWRLEVQAQPVAPSLERPHLRQRVVASLDAGLPVLSHSSVQERAVLFGYHDDGALLVGHDYDHPEGPWRVPPRELGPVQIYLGEHGEPTPWAESLARSLTAAVAAWEQERHDGGAQGRVYWYGDAAYGAWLRDLDSLEQLTDEQATACARLHAWCYPLLEDARAAAARFLLRHAATMEPAKRERIEQAASLYRQLAAALAEAPSAQPETVTDPAARQRQQRALSRARVLEAAAVDELRGALALDAVSEPTPRRVTGRDRGTAIPWTVVHREGTRVWLEGIDHRQYGQPTIGAATGVLRALGYQADYSYLMGISGAAFTLGPPDESVDLDQEAAFLEAALLSAGLAAEWPAPGSRREAIAHSVEHGRPLIYLGAETGCIYGHEGEGKVVLCRRSGEGQAGIARVSPDSVAGRVAVPVAAEGKPAQLTLALAALQRAVRVIDDPRLGPTIYPRWVAALRGPDGAQIAPDRGEVTRSMVAAIPRLLRRLADARTAAIVYLPVAACRLRRGREAVERAVSGYGEVTRLLADHESVLTAWSGPGAPDPSTREQVAQLLERIAGIETEALAALAQALQEETA